MSNIAKINFSAEEINTKLAKAIDAEYVNKAVDSTNNIFIRYSAYANGTGMTEEWSEGQNYIGFATGQTAPTDKGGYEWVLSLKGEKGNDGKDGQDSAGLAEFSPNLVNPAEFEYGVYINGYGELVELSYFITTGYIRVNGGQTYYIHLEAGGYNLTGYTEDKTHIGLVESSSSKREVLLPDNVAYVRLACSKVTMERLAIYNSNIEGYIPYYKRLREDVEIINQIDNTLSIEGKAADAKAIGEITKAVPKIEECWKYKGKGVTVDAHAINGDVVTTSPEYNYCVTELIPVKSGDRFALCYGMYITRYDAYKKWLDTVDISNAENFYGNERIFDYTVTDEAYIRVSMIYDYDFCATSRLDDRAYEVLCLGDSIFGNNPKPYDIPTLIQNVTGLKSANCGFGGTTARTHHWERYAPLSFHNIADCIASGDFSTIDIDWAQYGDHVFKRAVDILKAIDYSKLKVLSVAFGTNDWNLATNTDKIDNAENRLDVTTYKGALRHGIEAVLTAYPHILICLLSPLYRTWSNDSSDHKIVDDDSDNRTNAHNVKLMDYVTAMKEVAEEYHLPFFDNYSTMGINRITAPSILRDGTHLNYYAGVERVGGKIAEEINSII